MSQQQIVSAQVVGGTGGGTDTLDVHNSTVSTMAKGSVAGFTRNSATGGKPDARPLVSTDPYDRFIGIVTADITGGADGTVQRRGLVTGLDTSGFSTADELWVSDTGTLTNDNGGGGGNVNGAYYRPIAYAMTIHATTGSVLIYGDQVDVPDLIVRHSHAGLDAGGNFLTLPIGSYLELTEIAAPSNATSGTQRLYIDSTTHALCRKNSTGTVVSIG